MKPASRSTSLKPDQEASVHSNDKSVIDIDDDVQEDFSYWEDLSIESALRELGSSLEGFSTADAERRLAQDGPNEVSSEETSKLARFFSFLYVLYICFHYGC